MDKTLPEDVVESGSNQTVTPIVPELNHEGDFSSRTPVFPAANGFRYATRFCGGGSRRARPRPATVQHHPAAGHGCRARARGRRPAKRTSAGCRWFACRQSSPSSYGDGTPRKEDCMARCHAKHQRAEARQDKTARCCVFRKAICPARTSGRRPAKKKRQDAVFFVETLARPRCSAMCESLSRRPARGGDANHALLSSPPRSTHAAAGSVATGPESTRQSPPPARCRQ